MKNSIILLLLITGCSSPVKENIKTIKNDLQKATVIIDDTKKVISDNIKISLENDDKKNVILLSNLESNINDVKLLVNNAELKTNHLETLYVNEIKSLKLKIALYKCLLAIYTLLLIFLLKNYVKSNTLSFIGK